MNARSDSQTNAEVDALARRHEYERLLALRDFAYGASHELNNPLANIVSRAEALLSGETDSERRRMLATIVSQAYRAHEMIADVMLFARPPALRRAAIDLRPLLDRVASDLGIEAQRRGTTLRVSCADDLRLEADADQLGAALHAAGRNALEAAVEGGCVDFLAQHDGESFLIRVLDDGPAFSDDDRHRMFNPYYSGREAGRGLGLGLSKIWRIVSDHGGQVELTRESSRTQLIIQLPCVLANDPSPRVA